MQIQVKSFTYQIRLREKCHFYDFNHGIVVCGRWVGLSISENADLLGFLHTTVCSVYREWNKKQNKTTTKNTSYDGQVYY